MEDQAPSRFAAFRRGLRGGLRTALDVALPPLCPACREPVEDQVLCAGCWSKLSFIARPYCERLGIPFAYDAGPGLLSMQAMADPPAYNRARAAVRYDDIARALVHAFKYGDRILRPRSADGSRARDASCWRKPMRLFPCRCIGAGYGHGASTSQRRWRRPYRRQAACRCCTPRSSA
jgi:Double zinc ribbon domain